MTEFEAPELTLESAKEYVRAYYDKHGMGACDIEGCGIYDDGGEICRLNVNDPDGYAVQWDVWVEGDRLYGEC